MRPMAVAVVHAVSRMPAQPGLGWPPPAAAGASAPPLPPQSKLLLRLRRCKPACAELRSTLAGVAHGGQKWAVHGGAGAGMGAADCGAWRPDAVAAALLHRLYAQRGSGRHLQARAHPSRCATQASVQCRCRLALVVCRWWLACCEPVLGCNPVAACPRFPPQLTARHVFSLVTGVALIVYPFGSGCMHAFVPAALVYACMRLARSRCGTLAWAIAFPYLILQ